MASSPFKVFSASVLLVGLAGCSVTPVSSSPRGTAIHRRLTQLERGDDPQAVLDYVATVAPDLPRSRRAPLDLARARALTAMGRPRSALAAYQSASQGLEGHSEALEATILEEWADTEVGTGRGPSALRHYEQALEAGAPEKRVLASMAAVARSLGKTRAADAWEQRLGRESESLVARARARLELDDPSQGARPGRRVAGGRAGRIPGDVRSLQADIHTRADWGARPIGANRVPMAPVTTITVHHSAMDGPRPGDTRSHLRRIQDEHTSGRGWADIGYHFIVDPEGEVWEARALIHQGAHAGGQANVGNIGVCLLGNFDQSWVPPVQLLSLERLLDTLRERFGVPPQEVRTHREWKPTACPGRYLQAAVENYRSRPLALARQ